MRKRLFSLFLLCLILGATSGRAQDALTLNGYIRDAETGEDLIGANVLVQETRRGAATNAYGYYSLALPPGTYTLLFRYIGYESAQRTATLTGDSTLTVALRPDVEELEEVEVSAQAKDANVRSVEMGAVTLSARAIRNVPVILGETDVIKSLELLPGVTRASDATSSFNVRGGAGDQNLILLDEAPIHNAAHLFGLFSSFNGDVINDVKLYKGSLPARYGGRLSSVLDIHQREGNNQEFEVHGGVGLVSSRLVVEGPLSRGRGSFLVAGRRSYADLFMQLAGMDATAYFYDLNAKANLRLNDRDRLFLSGYLGRDRLKIGSELSNLWGNVAGTLRWNHIWGNRLFSNLSLIYSDYSYAFDILNAGSDYRWTAHTRNANLKTDFSFLVGESTTVDFGLGGIYYDFEPGAIRPIEDSPVTPYDLDREYAVEPSLYASVEQDLGENLTIEAGLRASGFWRIGPQTLPNYAGGSPVVWNDDLGRYENGIVVDSTVYGSGESIKRFFGLEPRASVRLTLSPDMSVKASYSRTRQYIHLISNTLAPTPLDIWASSGPYLEPQEGDQVSLGLFRNLDGDQYELSVEGYYKWLRNQVDYVDGADLLLNNTIETELLSGEGRAYGVELFLRKPTGRLTGSVSYAFGRAERRVPGLSENDPGLNGGEWYPSNYDKPHQFSAMASYRLSPTWSFSANAVVASGQPTTYPSGRYVIDSLSLTHFEGTRNESRLPLYHRLDLGATLHGWLGGDWTFSLYNVYNRKNPTSMVFRPSEDDPRVSESVRISLFGIVPGVTYNFNF